MKSTDKDKEIRAKINALSDLPENIEWNIETGWKQYQKKYRFSGNRKILYWAASAAAVLLLVILLFVVPYNGQETIQVSTQEGKTNITLQDGSKIWLNTYTKLTINQKEDLIKVSGEIYAELSGETKYKILAPNGEFRVAHCHFNLDSRNKNKRAVVSVAKGKLTAFWDVNKGLQSTIQKGIQAEIIPEVALVQAPIDDPNYLAWKTGQLKFDNTPLFSVINKLEELNDIKIQIQNKELRYCRMNSKFHSLSADTILKELPEYVDLRVKKQGDTYLLSGNGCNN
jgi:ferric-dicitrate binding protein FerR (iron transport regulator)